MNRLIALALLSLHAALPFNHGASTGIAVVLVLVVLVTPTLWSLIHEGIHGHLTADRWSNDLLARALAVAFGTPFRLARFGHLLHHRHNRGAGDQVEVFDGQRSNWLTHALTFYPRLLFGLYAAEWLANGAAFLPRRWLKKWLPRLFEFPDETARVNAEQELLSPASLRQVRTDASLILIFYGVCGLALADFWPGLLLAWFARGMIVSMLDNSYHYGTPLNDRRDALNFRSPRLLNYWCLNFPMHRTHHHHPHVPWTALPALTHYDARDPSLWRGVLRQLKGPIEIRRLA